eukprot:jgi/Botrbrau1/12125/Bobra.0186s0042.1
MLGLIVSQMPAACDMNCSLFHRSHWSQVPNVRICCSIRPRSRLFNRQPLCRINKSRTVTVMSELDPSTMFAIIQQGAAYVTVVLAEGFFTRTQLSESAKGRPNLLILLSCTAGLATALGLLSFGANDRAALGLGSAMSLVLLLLYIRRAIDVVGNPQDWPGPKVWPAGMALASFFAVQIFAQGLFKA